MSRSRRQTFALLERVLCAQDRVAQRVIAAARQQVAESSAQLEDAEQLVSGYSPSRFASGVDAPSLRRNQRFLEQVLLLRDLRRDEVRRAEHQLQSALQRWRALSQRRERMEEAITREARAENRHRERKMRRRAPSAARGNAGPWSMLNE